MRRLKNLLKNQLKDLLRNSMGIFLALQLSIALPLAPTAKAMDRDVQTVLTTSLYGMAVGTGLGLVSYPFAQSSRAIFIGTVVGLYLGAIVGIYHVSHRDDP